MKTQPPCYDRVNKVDCPNRQWCLKVGRSKCDKWVEYSKAHEIEKAEEYREAQERRAKYNDYVQLCKRLHRPLPHRHS